MIKVIVIEDERILRMGLVMTTNWGAYGCEVIGETEDGIEGYSMIRRLQPDIVITDIRMPGMNGIEMMKELKHAGLSDTEFIIITGFSDFSYAKAAVDLGAQGFILKPIDDAEFDGVLAKTIEAVRRKKKYDQVMRNKPTQMAEFYDRSPAFENASGNDRYLKAAIDFIGEHINHNFTIKDIADHLHISESYLTKLFKNKTSFTFLEYCTNYRVKRAAELLTKKDVKVYEVAGKVGYQDSRYFSTIFKKWMGLTPTEFRSYYVQE